MTTHVFCDGSCLSNPGPGGWAAIVVSDGNETILQGGCKDSTNNRMELKAAIEGVTLAKSLNQPIEVFTDSQYVVRGMTEWIVNWKAKNFNKVKNVDLWKELDSVCLAQQIKWTWVRGHNGHAMNERCDKIANGQATQFKNS